ncbi:hypothetical protein [Saccharibacillus endophyticus]|uniref:Uncharacterized protein n=1 Tax=Saccharibacillus endophyticus TaxID=2060666 RepID=A0ABQ1ZXA7_9BACL|nr:hypothetical protein [Saccharibacillus endophyticus]GGH81676.1 hypothetical protein GCM10007362_31840 [Saccharibacillus endophyticus]
MVESYVVSGRIIEQRGHVVITVQGGLVSSYDLRYYKLPEGERAEDDAAEDVLRSIVSPVVLSKWKRRAFSTPAEHGNKKSANRA